MEWYELLRDERARKIEAIEHFLAGNVQIKVRTDGVLRDASEETIADYKEHIAELEQILVAANEPLEG